MKRRGCVQAVMYQVQAQHSACGNIAREYISHDACDVVNGIRKNIPRCNAKGTRL